MNNMDEEEINNIYRFYLDNNMKEIRKICNEIISKTNMPKTHIDDYYSNAVLILMQSVKNWDKTKNCKFSTYFYGNLLKRRETWIRDNFRFKRCNLETDNKGKIKRDKKGNPTVIPDLSIHMIVDTEKDYTLEECISSDFNLEEVVVNSICPTTDRIELYKKNLSYKQQRAVDLICSGYTKEEIIKELNISDREYKDEILGTMRLYENVKVLLRE